MKYLRATLVAACLLPLAVACATGGGDNGSSGQTSSAGAGGAATECPPCQMDSQCATGSHCAQFAGDAYCAPSCASTPCASGRACMTLPGSNGAELQVCIPTTNVCGTTSSMSGSTSASSGGGEVCGSLLGPDVTAACGACKSSGQPCQANGCIGGWWCNMDTNACQMPPSLATCGGSTSSTGASTSSSSTSSSSGSTGTVGPTGGTLSTLSFAIVGDTRPPTEDDTAGYPTPIITKIWQEIEAASPRPAFAVTTGDYQFASTKKTPGTQATQIGYYMTARSAFSNVVFPAMGNHECDGATADNCSACGNGCTAMGGTCTGGACRTPNMIEWMSKMLTPIGQTLPYYTIKINGTNNAWTSKFVVVACNAWSGAQATWLDAELAQPTTYTFVVRHEGSDATSAPCLTGSPNATTIMAAHPLTLLIAGHTHTFEYFAGEKQMIVGNGGAMASGSVNYGYVLAQQQPNGTITFNEYDYSTNKSQFTYNVVP